MIELIAANTKFTVPQGLLLALVGFLLVICVLFVLMGFIYLLSFIVRLIENKRKPSAETGKTEENKSAEAPALAPGSSGAVKLNNVDERTAAMIMAIVADEMQTPLNELKFISIKEVTEEAK